jgi:hypothetical protein
MLLKRNIVLQNKFPTWIRLNFFQSFVNPLEERHALESNKGHHCIENEELFCCAKSRSKSLNLPFWIRKINMMHVTKEERLDQR